ncbi:MAG TPA: sugar ABC transporter substrate-binding protein [Rhodanobacter sp.]|nr:sugar ABC transporter substrate-binding protein [Rhodanobacter sp.]
MKRRRPPACTPSRPHRWWLVLLLAGTCGALSACSHRAPDTHTLTFWAMGNEGEAVAQLIPGFEHAHPGIHVTLQQLPWNEAHQKLLTAYAGDTTPDIAQLGNTWIAELAALHALQPLQPYVAHSRVVQPDDYFTGIWATNRIDGVLYGVPWYVDTRLLFYRTDLLKAAGFDAPPRSWAEWSRQMAALKARDTPGHYPMLLPTNEFEQLLSLALQQDAPLLRDGGRYGNFESPGFKRALAFYVGIFRQHEAPLLSDTEVANPWLEVGRGVYAFYLSGPWNIGEFRRRLPAAQQGDWSTAPLPGPDGPGAGIASGSSLVIFRRSRHQAQAWQLIEYLSQPAVQRKFYELVGDMPPRRSSWRNGTLRSDPDVQAFREQLERVKPTPAVPEWERIVTGMQLVAARAAHGELTVDQAAAEIDRRADAILAKRRWMLDHHRSPQP